MDILRTRPRVRLELKSKTVQRIIAMAVPVALAHLGNMSMHLVDLMFVGRLGPEAVASLSVGSTLFTIVLVFGIGLGTGVDYWISFSYGARRFVECRKYWVQSVYLSLMFGAIATVALWWTPNVLSRIGMTNTMTPEAASYLRLLSISLIPVLLFVSTRQCLQALGVTKAIFGAVVFGNICNIILNDLWVRGDFGFRSMGPNGSALATLVSRILMCGALYVILEWRFKVLGVASGLKKMTFHYESFVKIVKLGAPSAFQMLLEVGVFGLSTLLAARFGSETLSSHYIVLQVASMTFMISLGLSASAAVLVGQSLGSQHYRRAVNYGVKSLQLGVYAMIFTALVMGFFARVLMQAFTHDSATIEGGVVLMRIAALFQIWDGLQAVGTGVLRGLGDSRVSMIANLIGHWMIGLPIGMFLGFRLNWGIAGIWAGLSIGLALVAMTLVFDFKRRATKLFTPAWTPRVRGTL